MQISIHLFNYYWKTSLFTNYLETRVSLLIRSENQRTRVCILVITHLGTNGPPTPHMSYELHVFQHDGGAFSMNS